MELVLSLPQEAGTDTSPLAPLAAHRRVLGVVGLFYCPAIADLAKAYAAFEKQCRWDGRPLACLEAGVFLDGPAGHRASGLHPARKHPMPFMMGTSSCRPGLSSSPA